MTVLPPSPPPTVPLPTQPVGVAWPTNGWPTASPAPETVDELEQLIDRAFDPRALGPNTPNGFGESLALVVVHHGRLVAERYGPTAGPDELLISWSMAKSVTHALVGILVGQGDLDLDGPAPVPEWAGADDPRSAITIDHLLRMVPGTRFNEDYLDENTSHCIEMLFGSGRADMAAYTASQPHIAPPNTLFNYSSGTTNVLCRIIADIVGPGEAFEAWMHEVLLDPLNIEARLEFDGASTWVGSSFLHATARDFAKFGLLYARDGVWEGERLLPEGWVNYARSPRAIDDEDGARYGAHWWIWQAGGNANDEPDHGVFYASGYETQRIVVDPRSDLVIVRLGKTAAEQAPNVDRWLESIRALFDPSR